MNITREPVLHWYVLRTFTGQEKKVKRFLEKEVQEEGWEHKVREILIPTETVFEMRGGKKRTRERSFFPGYVLIRMAIDGQLRHFFNDRSRPWPSRVDFLGPNNEPTPLRPHEVDRILGRVATAKEGGEKPEIPFDPGDSVKVVDGPFNNFSGMVDEVFPDKMKVRVMVSIFGRKTPLELDYLQVELEK